MIAGRTLAVLAFGLVAGAGVGAWVVQRATPNAGAVSSVTQASASEIPRDAAQALAPFSAGSGATVAEARPSAAAAAGAPSAKPAATPEPPASWMTVEQQRAAALAYRDHVWESNRQSNERRRNLNAELFLIEGQDPAWGAAMESRVRASMASHDALKSAALETIECRVTVCRAVVRFVDDARPDGSLPHGGQSPWSTWRGAQIIPVPRSELEDQVPGFRATVYLGDDFQSARLPPPAPRVPAGPGGP